jgi:tRNA(Arg) A34 adenosine deaminase TadA
MCLSRTDSRAVTAAIGGFVVRRHAMTSTSSGGFRLRRLRPVTISDDDLERLARCVELARSALDHGDEPFGSILVDEDGKTVFEDRNRVKDGDHTKHPEFAIARWAVDNLTPAQRAMATVYTSGEHCPMCSAAHAWVGLGRIVYAASSAQLSQWLVEWSAPQPPVAPLPITTVAPSLVAEGPAPQYADRMKALYEAKFRP